MPVNSNYDIQTCWISSFELKVLEYSLLNIVIDVLNILLTIPSTLCVVLLLLIIQNHCIIQLTAQYLEQLSRVATYMPMIKSFHMATKSIGLLRGSLVYAILDAS